MGKNECYFQDIEAELQVRRVHTDMECSTTHLLVLMHVPMHASWMHA